MTVLLILVLFLTGGSGLAVVLTRDPRKQVFALTANGLVLAVLFFALQAPDVAFSEIAVGAAIVPLLFLVALTAIEGERRRRASGDQIGRASGDQIGRASGDQVGRAGGDTGTRS